MATNNNSSSNPRAEKMGDVLDALSSGIAKTAANEPKFESKLLVPEVPAEPARELLTEIMLAARCAMKLNNAYGMPAFNSAKRPMKSLST